MFTRFYTTLILLLWFSWSFSQSLKIQRPDNSFTTRAVIVGISDYEDEAIPDLQYAHKDAMAFADYLRSTAGGALSDDNIKVFTNEEAKGGNIHKALYWLVKESKKDDQCIIYFSGHGDVETIYEDEPGHFLVHDSPSSIYQINSIRLDDLNRIISTLSTKIGAKVTVITDACRSGKLAGSEINGAQATAAALSKQFSNEVKVMSCQANEYSIEGEQWGDGRGMFSYHLIEGLIGLADADNDFDVDLKEIQRYLEDRFDEDLVNATQTPLTIGDKKSKISIVDPLVLEELKLNKNIPTSDIAFAGDTQEKKVSSLEEGFYKAIKQKYFLEEFKPTLNDITELSALQYFEKMSLDKIFANKLPILKGDLIAALQNDAQQAINKYLQLDPDAFHSRIYGGTNQFDAYPKYLKTCGILLGEFHYLYPQVKAKELYFYVVSERIKLDRYDAESHAYKNLQGKLEDALVYQQRSPFILNELGLILIRQKKYNEAVPYLENAISISPTWAMPYNNISYSKIAINDYKSGVKFAKKALKLNDKIISAYANMSNAYYIMNKLDSSIMQDLEMIDNFPQSCDSYNNVGYKYYKNNQKDQALKYYNLAIECDSNFVLAHINKSMLKVYAGDYDNALKELETSLKNRLIADQLYEQIGYIYEKKNNYTKAIESYQKGNTLNPDNLSCIYYKAILFYKTKKYDEAIKEFKTYVKKDGENKSTALFYLACSHAMQNNLPEFNEHMKRAMKFGFSNKEKMEKSKLPSSIKSSKEYLEIIQKMN